ARAHYHRLYSFGNGSDGQQPKAGLIDVNGTLYGTTCVGGTEGRGAVFSISPTGAEKVLHSFDGLDGDNPWAGLVELHGTLYGTTDLGGTESGGGGTVFSITPSGTEKVLHTFDYYDGLFPVADLVAVKGVLYGTTEEGGSNNEGTVFSITPSGTEKVLHSFGGSASSGSPDGAEPVGGLIYVNGLLYGTTASGGSHYNSTGTGYGTVFSISTSGNEHVLFNFNVSDGGGPGGDLTNVRGTLYGIAGGGAYGGGVVFSITTGGTEKVLYNFTGGADGGGPAGGVIYRRGFLYGVTVFGGHPKYQCFIHDYCGTVFSVNTITGREKILHRFGLGSDGSNPQARLLDVNGTLYGTTKNGGLFSDTTSNAGNGTVFALKP
ncbi:MAG: choice-of-anchor tandem repeat GloVer-containing protein, partial [Candidatus Cybelea sp.]